MKREIDIDKTELLRFCRNIKIHIENMDKLMGGFEGNSFEKGQLIATEMNNLNFALDSFLHFSCNIDITKVSQVLDKGFTL
jgi:hypothetical protein